MDGNRLIDGALADAHGGTALRQISRPRRKQHRPAEPGPASCVVPALLGDQSVWAMPSVPYAGDGVGFFAMPPVGTGVWVEFEAGDLDYPIWSGCFWADGQISSSDAVPTVKFWKTDAVTVRIDDDAGEIVIETQAATLKLTATEITAAGDGRDAEGGGKPDHGLGRRL